MSWFLIESRFKSKHSLDSDEEDDIDEIQMQGLGEEDLDAQEDTTIVSSNVEVNFIKLFASLDSWWRYSRYSL